MQRIKGFFYGIFFSMYVFITWLLYVYDNNLTKSICLWCACFPIFSDEKLKTGTPDLYFCLAMTCALQFVYHLPVLCSY